MPPKRAQQAKLDREALQLAASERIDAITAEPLHPTKFIEIVSPDGTLRLFYNTSTLIRIGAEKGKMMQPPHFREEMHVELLKKIEELEGRKIVVTESIRRQAVDVDDFRFGEETGTQPVVEVVHRHVHFQQIVDEFYLLNSAQVFVCPVCYAALLDLHPEWRRPVDPLDALSEHDELVPMIVFRYAKDFRAHLANQHWMTAEPEENRLRDVLCTYFSDFNDKKRRPGKLNLQIYWMISARYNVVRYNHIVDIVEHARISQPNLLSQLAFPHLQQQAASTTTQEQSSSRSRGNKRNNRKADTETQDDDFLVDDDESDGDDGLYVALHHHSDQEQEENEEDDDAQKELARGRKRSRESSMSSSSSSCSSSASFSSSSSSSASTSDSAGDEEHHSRVTGYLQPHASTDRRSHEEKEYVQRALEKIHRQEVRSFGVSHVRRPHTSRIDTSDLESVPTTDAEWADFVNSGDAEAKSSSDVVTNPRDYTPSQKQPSFSQGADRTRGAATTGITLRSVSRSSVEKKVDDDEDISMLTQASSTARASTNAARPTLLLDDE